MKLQTKVEMRHYFAYILYRLKCDRKSLTRGREYRKKHLLPFGKWFVMNYGFPK